MPLLVMGSTHCLTRTSSESSLLQDCCQIVKEEAPRASPTFIKITWHVDMQSIDLFVLCMGWVSRDPAKKCEHLKSLLASFTHDWELLSLVTLSTKAPAVLHARSQDLAQPSLGNCCPTIPLTVDTHGTDLWGIHSRSNWAPEESRAENVSCSAAVSLKSSSSFMLLDSDVPEAAMRSSVTLLHALPSDHCWSVSKLESC
jgi:hypothetical protein